MLTMWPAPLIDTFFAPLIPRSKVSIVALIWGTSRSPITRSVGTLISPSRVAATGFGGRCRTGFSSQQWAFSRAIL